MKKQVYFGQFNNYEDFLSQWDGKKEPVPTEKEVIFASYGTPSYEGYAIAVFKHNGVLYEVNDSHCSCHGLENWEPEETTKAALGMRTLDGYEDHSVEAVARWHELFPPKKKKEAE